MEEFILDRKTAEITFDPHVFIRQHQRNFDVDFAEETVRKGTLVQEKSAPPNKACFMLYHGKERVTYVVIAVFYADFIEVKMVWPLPGRC